MRAFAFGRWGSHSIIAWIQRPTTWLGIRGASAQWLVLAFVVGIGLVGSAVMLAARGIASDSRRRRTGSREQAADVPAGDRDRFAAVAIHPAAGAAAMERTRLELVTPSLQS